MGLASPPDPLLARAAWGLRCGGRGEPNLVGPVEGPQTAQRAEVTAAVAAARATGAPVDLVTDSQYVANGCAKIAAGAEVHEWEHADLWRQLAGVVRSGRLRARWVPAHKTPAEARRLGVSERGRLGNAAADGNAGAFVASRDLPPETVRTRRRELELLEAAQRVLAAAQQAALAASQKLPGRRGRRDWSRVRRGARARAVSAPAGVVPASRAAPQAARPRRHGGEAPVSSGAMLAAFFAGRSWWPHSLAQGPGQVFCLRCGRNAAAAASLLGAHAQGGVSVCLRADRPRSSLVICALQGAAPQTLHDWRRRALRSSRRRLTSGAPRRAPAAAHCVRSWHVKKAGARQCIVR